MKNLTQKTTLLLSPELHKQLTELAALTHVSVGELIRRAVVERYLLSDRQKRLAAVRGLSQLNAPTGNWQTIEREIAAAKLADLL
ncbi:MAG: type II toxin-antitoxin system HicB family antitoxin [Candidatus Omnitrophica bacterium]|nr:type II toxin-antitoxin system HicB family antitoxin [Candidatus Omnitrophota bacterium]